jgi:hypothetical protein
VHRILRAFEIPRAGVDKFRPGSVAIAGGTLSHGFSVLPVPARTRGIVLLQ